MSLTANLIQLAEIFCIAEEDFQKKYKMRKIHYNKYRNYIRNNSENHKA